MSDGYVTDGQKEKVRQLNREAERIRRELKKRGRTIKRGRPLTRAPAYSANERRTLSEGGVHQLSPDDAVNYIKQGLSDPGALAATAATVLGVSGLTDNDHVRNARNIFETIKTIKKNLISTKSISEDLLDTGRHRFSEVYDALDATPLSIAVDDLKKYLTMVTNDDTAANEIIEKLDLNKDDMVDENELDKFSKIENNTVVQRIINDPSFRTQIVQRRPYSSIYKDDFSKYNNVETVMHAYALDSESASFGNAAFE